MCRNIRTLFNFEPPATDDEIAAASRLEEGEVSGTGRTRRYFKLEPAGLERLKESRKVMEPFWEGLDEVMEGKG